MEKRFDAGTNRRGNRLDDKVGINAVWPGEIHTPMLEAGATRFWRSPWVKTPIDLEE